MENQRLPGHGLEWEVERLQGEAQTLSEQLRAAPRGETFQQLMQVSDELASTEWLADARSAMAADSDAKAAAARALGKAFIAWRNGSSASPAATPSPSGSPRNPA